MSRSRGGPGRSVLAFVVYACCFLMCLIGSSGVLLVVGLTIAWDLLLGILAGDFAARWKRVRW